MSLKDNYQKGNFLIPDALFSIVNFPNEACLTTTGDTGLCVASR